MKKNTRIKGAINRRKRKASKYNLGGAYSNPTLPMSSSTMAGIPGQQQAQQEFQNLQMQSARARRMNERAQQLEQEAAEQKTKDDFQQSASAYGSTALQGIGKAADAFRASQYAAQNAAIASQAGGQTSNLLGILGQQSLNTPKMGMGQSLLQGAKGLGKTGGGAVLGLAGAGIQRLSDDQDETTLNVGETTGTLMKGAGAGLGLAGTLGSLAPALAIPGIGWAAAGIGAGIAGVKAFKNRNEQRDIQAEEEEQQRINDLRMGRAQNAAFRQGFTQSGIDQGYNIGNSMTNSYIPGYQMAKYGGVKKYFNGGPAGNTPNLQVTPEQQAMFARLNPTLNAQIQDRPQSNDRLTNYSANQLDANENRINKARASQAINKGVQTGKDILSDPTLAMDAGQLALAGIAASEIPVASQAAGLANAGIYGARGAYYGAKGLANSDPAYAGKGALYGGLSAMSLAGMVPGAGAAADASVLGSMAGKLKSGLNAAHHTKAAHLAHEGSNIYKASNLVDAGANTLKYGGKKVSGGEIQGMPGGAKKFVGKSHEQGGIMLDRQTEVEGGETMDKVKMSDGNKSDYIFSKTLRLGGKSFAQRHEEILRRGGSKGRMQKKIQDLAKMQEAIAAKQGKDENGPRDPNMIAKMEDGGEVEDKFDDTVLPGKNVLSTIPEGQSIFTDGLYTQDQGFILDQVKERNPWFDWGDFDPSNAEDVKRFQQAYNDKVPKGSEVTVDGKFGDQTASIYLDMKEIDRIGKQDYTPKEKEGEEKTEEKAEEPADKEESSEEVFTKSKMNMGPGTLAALSGLAQLPRKLKALPKAANITPQQTGKIKLPRVNYNAERAAGAAGTTSVNRAIQNQAAGPGGIAAMMANTDRQRQNNIQIANAEAQANKQLMSQETMTNAQIAQQNAANAMNAQQFNEQSKYARDLENYQQNLLRQQAIGKTIAGVGKDFMGYRSDERLATAMDDVGAYQRFIEQNKMNSKTENRNGGKRKYISKSNKVRRKKK